MIDMHVKYAGLDLKSPIIAGSCGLNRSVDKAKGFQEAGAGAIILPSLFEEQIELEISRMEAEESISAYTEGKEMLEYFQKQHALDEYLELIKKMKSALDIPVIASVNCFKSGSWMEFAHRIAAAGADALELNIFYLPSDPEISHSEIRNNYLTIARKIVKAIDIPVILKLGSYFDNVAGILKELSYTGISGLVLFNRFVSPDIDVEKMSMISSDVIHSEADISNSLRWIGIMHDHVDCDLCASSGVKNGEDVIKMLLAGADAVQMASVLYREGADAVKNGISYITDWMQRHNYNSIADFRGKLSQASINDSSLYERVQFLKYFTEHK